MKKTRNGEELTRLTDEWVGKDGEVYVWVDEKGRIREVEESEEAKNATVGGPLAWLMDRMFPIIASVHEEP